jgi:hypothetical protein
MGRPDFGSSFDAVALEMQDQIIFGWLYLRHHLGDALGWRDAEKTRLWAPDLAPELLQRLAYETEPFFPLDTRPRLQVLEMRTRADGYSFRVREADDSLLSQLLSPGPGYLEAEIEVVDSSAWRLVATRRVVSLDPHAAVVSSLIDVTGRLLLAPDGRQVVVTPGGELEAQDTRDEVPPRYRVEPESGQGQWYRTPSLERAHHWARHFSREEGQRYLVYDRESLEAEGEIISVFEAGAARA